eukprot:TRINITY_DN71104_c0_g1_i1.p1 TRINITY_DN71104_c0_g1~~TRINITY_DN71104_c0_g1_i1.p1  ORF type:complete len:331 (+),score=43.97 TRINITY_DN71104_c0_g1_i1:78-995(+)
MRARPPAAAAALLLLARSGMLAAAGCLRPGANYTGNSSTIPDPCTATIAVTSTLSPTPTLSVDATETLPESTDTRTVTESVTETLPTRSVTASLRETFTLPTSSDTITATETATATGTVEVTVSASVTGTVTPTYVAGPPPPLLPFWAWVALAAGGGCCSMCTSFCVWYRHCRVVGARRRRPVHPWDGDSELGGWDEPESEADDALGGTAASRAASLLATLPSVGGGAGAPLLRGGRSGEAAPSPLPAALRPARSGGTVSVMPLRGSTSSMTAVTTARGTPTPTTMLRSASGPSSRQPAHAAPLL